MTVFDASAALVVLATVFGYVNYRFIHLPHVIGLTIMGALTSVALVGADAFVPQPLLGEPVRQMLSSFHFETVLIDGMLSFLLFAGAVNLDLEALMARKYSIALLATLGVFISTAIVGLGVKEVSILIGREMPFAWCLVFGALISPTDPLAVLAILKTLHTPKDIETQIAGESLFNDGMGVVLFTVLLEVAVRGGGMDYGHAAALLAREAAGGLAYGLAIGWVAFLALKAIDEPNLEVLITIALVMGGYDLAHHFGVSGPLSMAVAGLVIGNHGRRYAMSPRTQDQVAMFWSVLDETLNSVLFLMIGLEIVILRPGDGNFAYGAAAIVVALVARVAGVAVPLGMLTAVRSFARGSFPILVWGGLRGGLAIAMALSVPKGPERDTIVFATYCVVIFSVVVQGYTIGALARRVLPTPTETPTEEPGGGNMG